MTWRFNFPLFLGITLALLSACDSNDNGAEVLQENTEQKPNVAILLFDKSGSNRIDSLAVKKALSEAIDEMVVRPKSKKGKVLFCHNENVVFCGTIDGKTINRGLRPLHWEVERFCRQECDNQLPTSECNKKERAVHEKIQHRKIELDSLVWNYRKEPPADRTTTDVLSALVAVANEINGDKYARKSLHIFSDMLTEVRGGRNFDRTPPPDDATARQWAQEDWAALKQQYGLKDEGFRGMRVVCHTPPSVKNLQKVALYWRHLFEDVLQTARVEGL